MNNTTVIFFLMIQMLCAHYSSAQRFNGRNYFENDGLASQKVYSITQDHRGHMWFLTQNGISIYDGVRWEQIAESIDLATSRKSKIKAMPDSSIWVAGLDKVGKLNIHKHKNGNWQRVTIPPNISALPLQNINISIVFSIEQCTEIIINNDIYYVHFSESADSWKFLRVFNDKKSGFINKTEVIDGHYLLTTNNYVYSVKGDTISSYPLPFQEKYPSSNIKSITYSESRDSLYVLGNDWLGMVANDSFQIMFRSEKPKKIKNRFWSYNLLKTDDYPLLFSANGWHYLLHPTLGNIPLTTDYLNLQLISNQIFVDRQRNIWIATDRGLTKISKLAFFNYYTEDGLLGNEVSALTEISPNKRLVAGNKGFQIFEGRKPTSNHLVSSDENFQRTLISTRSKDGRLHLANYVLGLVTMDPENLMVTENQAGDQCTAVTAKGDTLFYVRAATPPFSGIGLTLQTKVADQIIDTTHLDSIQMVRRIVFDKNGELMLLAKNGLLSRKGKPLTKSRYANIYKNNLFDYCNFNGKEYFGTLGGLYERSADSLKLVNFDGKNITNSVYAITTDKKGQLWLGTDFGVYIYHPEKGLRNLNTADGLSSNEINRGALLCSSDGEIWIGTSRGLSIYHPEFDFTENKPPIVTLKKVVVNDLEGKPLTYGNVFSYGQSLEFHFTAASFINERQLEYKYRLKGFEEKWQEISGQPFSNRPRYNNLESGSYIFEVMAREKGGVWSPLVRSPLQTVVPPFYKSNYFKLAIVVLIAGFGYLLRSAISAKKNKAILEATIAEKLEEISQSEKELRKGNQRLKKANAELDSFVYRVSHDLRSPIASSLGLLQLVHVSSSLQEQESYLSLLEKSLKRIDSFIQDILILSRNSRTDLSPTPIDFKAIIEEVFAQHAYDEDAKKVAQYVEVQLPATDFHSDASRIKFVFNNLIANAIRYHNPYAEHPYVSVTVKECKQGACITVVDNGLGIEKDHKEKVFDMFFRGQQQKTGSGLGLYIVKEAVEKLEGQLHLSSEVNQGTTFTITLPNLKKSNPSSVAHQK